MRPLANRQLGIHLLALVAFNSALFAPIMGRGFLFDDFGHLFAAGYESIGFGLTRASGGMFYAPLAYLSFKIDWLLWGPRPFPWAFTNLVIHSVNTLLVYLLARQLWRSQMGAWWAAFGFALLFRANVGAIMNIASRAHLIVALFYLAAMHATLSFARTERSKIPAAVAVVMFATFAMFAKESGLTVLAAIGLLIFYERACHRQKVAWPAVVSLLGALLVMLLFYLSLRTHSRSAPISFSGPPCCSYVLSLTLLGENILFYLWWTYGVLALLGIAVIVSLGLRGIRPRLDSVTRYDFMFSLMLFVIATAPFILMDWRTEAYSYLPGISAALLLGAIMASLYQMPWPVRLRPSPLALMPVICVVALYVAFAVMHSSKWLRMARTNAAVLAHIAAQQPKVEPNTFITLTYAQVDSVNRFPDGFQDYSFPWALRVLYGDPTLDGKIVRQGEPSVKSDRLSEVRFFYLSGDGRRRYGDALVCS